MVSCDGVIQSNVIVGNSADTTGGGLARCQGSILNNTIYGNTAKQYGGGFYSCNGTIANCIIWGNDGLLGGDQVYASSIPSFSCVQDWSEGGTGNVVEPPALSDPGAGNYRLSPESPCIDSGDNSVLHPPGLDMERKLRIAFGERSLTVDMGAYEHNSRSFGVSQAEFDQDGSLRLTWSSQPNDVYAVWTSVDLLGGEWLEEGDIFPSQGDSTSWTLQSPVGRMRFFKLRMK